METPCSSSPSIQSASPVEEVEDPSHDSSTAHDHSDWPSSMTPNYAADQHVPSPDAGSGVHSTGPYVESSDVGHESEPDGHEDACMPGFHIRAAHNFALMSVP
jgi:hypothetical protein